MILELIQKEVSLWQGSLGWAGEDRTHLGELYAHLENNCEKPQPL